MSEDQLYTRCGHCGRWHPKGGDDRLWLDAESQPMDRSPSDTICPLCILTELGEEYADIARGEYA